MVLDAFKTRYRGKTDFVGLDRRRPGSWPIDMVGALSQEGETIIENNKNRQNSQINEQHAVKPFSIMVRLFAVSVLLVGGLDMMLSWRRGLEANWFFVALFMTGGVLYAVSKIMRSDGLDHSQ